MARQDVANLVVETLVGIGVERIYGIVGDSLNGLTDALRRSGRIRWVHVRHEEAAAFAAGAEAHLTGRLAVCAGSCGPGNLHLINGLYDAHRSRVPVLAVAAQIPTPELGSNYFQETNPGQTFADCSHYVSPVTTVSQVGRTLDIAIREAVTRRGVSVVVIPGDVFLSEAPAAPAHVIAQGPPAIAPPAEDVDRLAAMLRTAGSVTLLCGAGCAGAHTEVLALAERLKSPIVHTMRGKEYLEYDNPYDVGMTGLIGFASGYYAIESGDMLLMLGTDFPYRQFYPADAKIAQVDNRGENLGRRTRIDLGLVGDVKATLEMLLPRLPGKTDSAHLDRAVQHYRRARRDLDDLASGRPGRTPIHPQYVVRKVSELATPDAIFTADVGTPTIWAARYLKMNGRRRLLGSFNHGSMANALPQAIGAQATFPGRQVISLSGDGGFAMLMGEFLTLTQMKLPVKVIVFNNSILGFVSMEMKASGFLPEGVDLENPNFAKLAEAAGALGLRAEDPVEVEPALVRAFAHEGPVLLDVVTNRTELAMPPRTTMEQMKGFGLYLTRAILNGRADEVVELARTHLWR